MWVLKSLDKTSVSPSLRTSPARPDSSLNLDSSTTSLVNVCSLIKTTVNTSVVPFTRLVAIERLLSLFDARLKRYCARHLVSKEKKTKRDRLHRHVLQWMLKALWFTKSLPMCLFNITCWSVCIVTLTTSTCSWMSWCYIICCSVRRGGLARSHSINILVGTSMLCDIFSVVRTSRFSKT